MVRKVQEAPVAGCPHQGVSMSNQPIQIIEHRIRVFSRAEADGVRQAGLLVDSDHDVDSAAIVGL
jgi:hypothetical protein